jgi:hypothetical protein
MLRIWIAIAIMAGGCGRHINPEYCAVHPEDSNCPTDCETMCAPLACDHESGTCVECTPDDNICPKTAPMCGSDFHCHSPCDDCASQVCKADGTTCEDQANVIYVSPVGSNTATCTIGDKCSLKQGLTLIGGTRLTVKLEAGGYAPPNGAGVQIGSVGGRLIGYGATLTGGGPVIDVLAGADVELDGMQISGGMGGGVAFGLRCAASAKAKLVHLLFSSNLDKMGAAVSSACNLTMDASTFTTNERSLVITGGLIDIRNSLFVKNGKADLTTSPISITGDTTGGFRFNTVVYNTTKMGTTAGVTCSPTDPTVLNTDGNIVTDNNDQAKYSAQTAGGCSWSTSYTSPGTGSNQLVLDPLSYHLTANSPSLVRDVDGVNCDGMTDIDGDDRPINGGLRLACDLGCDELKP